MIVSGLDAKEVRRTPTYWLLAAVQIFTTFATGGIIAHLAPMMIDRGETATKGAEALALCTLGGTGGRLLMGLLLDRFRSPRIAVPFALGAVGGVLLLIYARSAPQFVAAGMLISVCMGAEGELAPYLHSRYFGLKAFAETFGLQFLFLAFANGVGITAMGAVFDAAGSYRPLLWAHAVLFSLVAGRLPAAGTLSLFVPAPTPRPPAGSGGPLRPSRSPRRRRLDRCSRLTLSPRILDLGAPA
ncbi:MAG: hypothetical protein WDM92_01010 [Caulobacteraceae bacterium]